MSGWIFVFIAVGANVLTNFSLKTAVRSVDTSSVQSIVMGFVTSPHAWLGLVSGFVLLGSFVTAIRTLPLSAAYPVLTALAIVVITVVEWMGQGVPVSAVRAGGIALAIAGIVLIASGA